MTDSIGTTIGSTSSSLLARVKARDQEAWERLLRLYGPLVDFWVRKDHLQSADASDIFQEIFRAVAEGLADFQQTSQRSSFRGWLRTITSSKVADHFRQKPFQTTGMGGSEAYRQLQQTEDCEPDCEDPGEADAVRQLRQRAMELIQGEFEPKTWEMFWRVAVDGHATKDVAADMGVSQAAVRQAKYRVLGRLREEF